MRGEYRDVAPPERSVHLASDEDFPGESFVTGAFMEHGAAESYDKLTDLVAELA